MKHISVDELHDDKRESIIKAFISKNQLMNQNHDNRAAERRLRLKKISEFKF
jgi:hypothetical protein